MRRPLLVLFLAWVAGLLLSDLFSLWALPPLLAAAVVTFLFGRVLPGGEWSRKQILLLLTLIMSLLGFLRHNLTEQFYRSRLAQVSEIQIQTGRTWVRGVMDAQFQRTSEGRWVATVSEPRLWDGDSWHLLPGAVEIRAVTSSQPLGEAGQIVEFHGSWDPVSGSRGPGLIDARGFHEVTGVLGRLRTEGSATLVEEPGWLGPRDRLVRLRDRWRSHIRRWALARVPGEAGSLALAMTTGERGYMGEQTRHDLLDSGLYHLTAISGLNITVVLLTLPLLLKPLGIRRRWRALIGIPLAVLLVGLVGGQVSVLRAGLMGVSLMLALFLDRTSDALNLLAGAGLLILVLQPAEIHQAGFLLSFGTVAALLLGSSLGSTGSRLDMAAQRWLRPGLLSRVLLQALYWTGVGLRTSFIATLAVAPISAWFFHSVVWKGFLGNILAVPIAEVITVLGIMGAFGLAFIPFLGDILCAPLRTLSNLLLGTLGWISSWPFGLNFVLAPDLSEIALILGVGLVILLPGRAGHRTATLSLLAMLSWWGFLPNSGEFRLHFLDVGQGDSCLLEFPKGERILVDTGPPSPGIVGRNGSLSSMLLSLGTRRLDAVVITHPEADHVGGLREVLETFEVGKILLSGDTNDSPSYQNLAAVIDRSRLPSERLLAGDRLDLVTDATLTVLYPSYAEIHKQVGSRNERSLVFLLEHAGLRVLFPGDIDGDVEKELIETYPDLRCDVLKVAHHGSRFSTLKEFADRVRPRVAVIQCGENSFGHPTPETLRRLEEAGADVFINRYDGTIQLAWDGRRLSAKTWRGD